MINLSKKLTYASLLAIVVATLVVFGVYKIHSGDNFQDLSGVDNTLNVVIIIGVLFGIVKFASKISLGCSFAKLTTIEVVTISVVYFCIPMILALFIDIIGNALGSVMGSITEMNAIIGGSQAIISIILLAFGVYTVKMWTKSKRDISKKTSIFMVFPCPGTILTMFTTSSLLVIAGIDSFLVGLLIGGIFLAFIWVGGSVIKKTHIRRDPTSFGGAMIFFGILYVFSVLFVPAYIPVSQMTIDVNAAPLSDLLPGIIAMTLLIIIGFIFEMRKTKKECRGE